MHHKNLINEAVRRDKVLAKSKVCARVFFYPYLEIEGWLALIIVYL